MKIEINKALDTVWWSFMDDGWQEGEDGFVSASSFEIDAFETVLEYFKGEDNYVIKLIKSAKESEYKIELEEDGDLTFDDGYDCCLTALEDEILEGKDDNGDIEKKANVFESALTYCLVALFIMIVLIIIISFIIYNTGGFPCKTEICQIMRGS